MRIGFDAKRAFNNFTGLGNYARNLLTSLAEFYNDHEYYLYTTKADQNEITEGLFNKPFNVVVPDHLFKSWWRSFEISDQLQKDNIELYHGLSNELPINIQKSGIKSIVTIHDLIFKVNPDWYPLIDRNIYDAKFSRACKQADQIVAISENTKADIIKYYDIPEEKITVIYQSCHPNFYQAADDQTKSAIAKKYNLPDQYLLYVGGVNERKNLLGIVKALSLLPIDMRLPLVVVGSGKKYLQKVKKWVHDNLPENKIVWIEQGDSQDLPAIYQQATLFLYPSFYEGFGIPVIEALFSRTPVITSNTSSLKEAGGPTSSYVNPGQPEQIAKAIEKILTDDNLKSKMTEEGIKYVQKFHRETITKDMMSLYQKMLNR